MKTSVHHCIVLLSGGKVTVSDRLAELAAGYLRTAVAYINKEGWPVARSTLTPAVYNKAKEAALKTVEQNRKRPVGRKRGQWLVQNSEVITISNLVEHEITGCNSARAVHKLAKFIEAPKVASKWVKGDDLPDKLGKNSESHCEI